MRQEFEEATLRSIEEFDEAAQHWGWESDQGYNRLSIEQSKDRYDKTKQALIERVNLLLREDKALSGR